MSHSSLGSTYVGLFWEKNIPAGITDGYLWPKSRLCSCHNELSESSTSCVSCPKIVQHALRKRSMGHLHLLHEVAWYLSMHRELVWGWLSSWFNVLISLFFEWRVSLSSDGTTLLNYNCNLLKHWFLRPFICILQHCLKWRKVWITKPVSVIYFHRLLAELVLHMSHQMTENSAFQVQCLIQELCKPFCVYGLCFVI